MDLSIIISVLNQFELFEETLSQIISNTQDFIEIIVIDNGSDEILSDYWKEKRLLGSKYVRFVRNDENIGNYPIFKQGLELSQNEIIAFFHSDLFIYEKGWDKRVVKVFKENSKLGLIGFIGSNEIDSFGGRGLGTMSNFQGRQIGKWKGSPAEVHGKRINDFRKAVLIDGCSMIFRRKCLEDIGFRPDFPVHHFYDRLMCCQVIEKGWEIRVLGIECDHISGMTVSRENKYYELVKKWFLERGINSFDEWYNKNIDWVNKIDNPNRGVKPTNYDHLCYLEAEKQFLTEWRDQKGFIPRMV
uniref:Glycosyltransferase family 2 protein n=1 Tax=Dictyoglomus turgidum TaxID=513050 RepID=A0A7C3SPF6_9BACT